MIFLHTAFDVIVFVVFAILTVLLSLLSFIAWAKPVTAREGTLNALPYLGILIFVVAALFGATMNIFYR